MTKSREIEILDATIAQLGPHSYLGPWLTESRHAIVWDITNDVCQSSPMPAQARAEALQIIADAKRDAAKIVADAEERARVIKVAAVEERDATRRRTLTALHSLIAAV